MNKALFKDPLFWAGALAVSFGLFQLASQNITLPSFSSAGSIKTFDDATPRKVRASQATLSMLGQVNQYQQAAQPRARVDEMIKKSRPKNSDSIWRVGTSDLADSQDLSAVMANFVDGDSIELESGSYSLKFPSMMNQLSIEGLPGATVDVVIEDGSGVRYLPTKLTLKNMTLDFSKSTSSYWFSGWNKEIELDTVKLIGAEHKSLYLNDGVVLKIKDSTLQRLTLYLNDSSKTYLENVEISQIEMSAIRLKGSADLKIKNVVIKQVDSGIYFGDSTPTFSAEDLTITEAYYAFYAYTDVSRRIDVKNGKFSKLRKVLYGDKLRLLCDPCSEEQITSR